MVNDNTRLTDDALAGLARLCEAATPGPWRAGGGGYIGYAVEDAKGQPVVYDEGEPDEDTARYIAAANPSTVAALVAEVQRLRAEVETKQGRIKELNGALWESAIGHHLLGQDVEHGGEFLGCRAAACSAARAALGGAE